MLKLRSLTVGAVSVVVGLLIAGAAAAQECEPGKVAQKYAPLAGKTVKVAATPTYPPFTYTDPKDPRKLTGLEVEIIESALNCAGVKFEYVMGPWSGLLPTLFSGATDVMVGNVNYRADRAEKADFVVFMRNGTSVVVQKGNPKKIKDADGLCGVSATASVGGSSALEIERLSKVCVEKGKPAIAFQASVDQEAAYRQLASGRTDFVMDGTASAVVRLEKHPEFESAVTMTTENVSGPVAVKGNAAMVQLVHDGLQVLEKSGELKKLMAKYGMPEQLLIPIQIRK